MPACPRPAPAGPDAQRRCPVGGPRLGKAAGPGRGRRRVERGHPGGAGGRKLPGGRTDQACAPGAHHRLLLRRRHPRRGGDRPGHRTRNRRSRPLARAALAEGPASRASAGRWRAHGRRCRGAGHAGAVRIRPAAGGAAHGRLAAPVCPGARHAVRAAACGDRPPCRDRADLRPGHRALDGARHLRHPAAGQRRPAVSGPGQRRDGDEPGRHADAGRNPRQRPDLSLCRRPGRRLHPHCRSRRRICRPGHRADAVLAGRRRLAEGQ